MHHAYDCKHIKQKNDKTRHTAPHQEDDVGDEGGQEEYDWRFSETGTLIEHPAKGTQPRLDR